MGNLEQQENWNGPGGQSWVRYQERIDRAVQAFSAAVLQRLGAQPGESIIDVGCGAGTTTLALAQAVGESGKVLGLDFSEPLLDLARKRCAALPQVSLLHGDAGQPRAERDFDALFSRFGVMFFDQPSIAFANLRHCLREDARLTFLCWQQRDNNPWVSQPMACMLPFLPQTPPPPTPHAPGAFGLADKDYTRAVLSEAGFKDIEIDPITMDVTLSTEGVASAVDFNMKLSPAAHLTKDLPSSTIEKIEAAFTELFEQCENQGHVTLPGSAWIVTGRA